MTRRRQRVRGALAAAVAAASLCAACGFIDAACWAPFADEEELCQRTHALAVKATEECDAPARDGGPPGRCQEIVSCLIESRHGCVAEWQALWACADAEARSCDERSADGGLSGFCAAEQAAFYDCALDDTDYADRNALLRDCLGLCGNNVCDADFGEDPSNCGQDCPIACDGGSCRDAAELDVQRSDTRPTDTHLTYPDVYSPDAGSADGPRYTCGDTLCEPQHGETHELCPQDCAAECDGGSCLDAT